MSEIETTDIEDVKPEDVSAFDEEKQTDTNPEIEDESVVETDNETDGEGESEGEYEPEPEPEADTEEEPEADTEDEDEVAAEIRRLELKGQAAERFRELSQRPDAATTEELTRKAQQADEISERWGNAQPEQIEMAQNIVQAVNSGDPDKQMEVIRAFRETADGLEKQLGIKSENLPEDLARDVENMELSPERAQEIARSRALEEQRTRYSLTQAEQAKERQLFEQSVRQSIDSLDQMEATWRENDPDFEAKLPYLQPTLDTIRESLPPDKWPEAIQRAYAQIPAPVKRSPVRASAGAMRPAPKSTEDAFDAGLA